LKNSKPQAKSVNIRIVGHKLPGLEFNKDQGAQVDRKPVYLGIQKKDQVVDLVPGNAPNAEFNFSIDTISKPSEGLDLRGPFVHGKKGDRFLYLSWGELSEDGNFTMFRRAKIHLSAIPPKLMKTALSSAGVLEASLDLTDSKGGPICSSVDKMISWRILPAP
jgi:Family of unknown function (DUF5990)